MKSINVKELKIKGKFVPGKYVVDFSLESSGKRKRVQLRYDADSMIDARSMGAVIAKGFGVMQRANTTVSEVWDNYHAHIIRVQRAKQTIKQYEWCFTRHLLPHFGRQIPEFIDHATICEYQDKRLQESPGCSPEINDEITKLGAAINWAADPRVGLIANRMCKWFRLKESHKPRVYYTKQEVEEILSGVKMPHHRVIYSTLYYTGLRKMEVLGLKWEDVDLKNGKIRVLNTKTGVNKYKRIPGPLMKLWSEYVKVKKDATYCFPGQRGNAHMMDLFSQLKKLQGRIDLGKHLHAHAFRHSFASRLLKENVSTLRIRDLLDQVNVSTTEKYTHQLQEQLDEVVDDVFENG